MSTMPPDVSSSGPISHVDSLLADLQRKRSEVDDQRRELSVLIKQTASEIDRISGRVREAGTQLRQVESNLGSFSQADIKRAYGASQEAQMRQFMMQSQLEQLRNRLTGLDSSETLLHQLIDAAEGLSAALTEAEGRASQPANRALNEMEQTSQDLDVADAVFRTVELTLGRLSRQLQEETAQTLSDLILRAEVCERLVEMDPRKARVEVARLRQRAAAALKATRLYSQELRSPALDEEGVSSALRRYVDSLKSGDKLQADIQISGLERDLSSAGATAIFRIAQEALTNVARHSGVSRAEVRLRYEPDLITISIADEGRGFDVDRCLQQARSREQAGLMDMQHRATLVGGTLDITSRPGYGCVVNFSLPI